MYTGNETVDDALADLGLEHVHPILDTFDDELHYVKRHHNATSDTFSHFPFL